MTIDNPDVNYSNFSGVQPTCGATPDLKAWSNYYDIDGKESESFDESEMITPDHPLHDKLEKVYNSAYAIQRKYVDKGGSATVYYCAFYRGKLFDPTGIDHRKKTDAEFRQVTKEVFDFYKHFLVTKNNTSLIHAERKLIDV